MKGTNTPNQPPHTFCSLGTSMRASTVTKPPPEMGRSEAPRKFFNHKVLPHSGFWFQTTPLDMSETAPYARFLLGAYFFNKGGFFVDVRPAGGVGVGLILGVPLHLTSPRRSIHDIHTLAVL
jgi:hypothetical protein